MACLFELTSMGNDEAVTPSKSDKASSPLQDQPVVHPYPDWAAVQAYYGPGVPMLPPYFSTAVAPGHPSHSYMWGPQPLMPPFATPYTAIYPHGVYPHPSMVSPSTTDVPAKSSNSKDKGLMKKLKVFDGLSVSIGNVNAEITVGDGRGQSQSGENGAEGSSDASDENNESGGKENRRKRSSEDTLTPGNRKAGALNVVHGGETNASPDSKGVGVSPSRAGPGPGRPGRLPRAPNCVGPKKIMALNFPGPALSPSAVTCKPIGTVPASSQTPRMELRTSATSQLKAGVHPEPWTQYERELKREKRKQSNRESARRSRFRKQAETGELAMKVENLGVENTSLRSEINWLKEDLEKLKAENSSLLERLKNVHGTSDKTQNQEAPSVVVENFLSRIDELRQDDNRENSSGGKLHQLLDSSPRTDAVAAG